MDKHAAEKIASEYYNMGIQLALQNAGLVKTARPSAGQLAAMLGGGGAAASLGTGASGEALMAALKSINPKASFDPAKLEAIMSGMKQDVSGYGDAIGGAYNRGAEALANLLKSAPAGPKLAPSYDDVLGYTSHM